MDTFLMCGPNNDKIMGISGLGRNTVILRSEELYTKLYVTKLSAVNNFTNIY